MPTDVLSAVSAPPHVLPSDSAPRTTNVASTGSDALDRLHKTLDACESTAVSAGDWTELRAALRTASRACAALPRTAAKSALVAEARALVRTVAMMGGAEIEFSSADLTEARAALGQGWPGQLAAMLLVPAWELPEAPRLDAVPDWLWGDYVAWLFAPPRDFTTPGLAARRAAQQRPHLADLNAWTARNAGSAAVRAAVEAYLATLSPGVAPTAGGRPEAELRGQILTRSVVRREDRDFQPVILPRDGRALRVGFVGRDFAGRPAALTALACFEQLDPASFEVYLFLLQDSDPIEARPAAARVRSQQVLAPEIPGQLRQLREAQLDVLVFCGDIGTPFDGITQLALHRIAPLQVVNDRRGHTSGLPEIDLYLSGALPATTEAAATFTERLGLLRGPAQTFAFPRAHATVPLACTREDLGLAADAMIVVSVVQQGAVTFETCRAWAAILAQAPEALMALAVVAAENEPRSGLARFCRGIEQVFTEAGVATSRISIFPAAADAPEQSRNLLRVADLFLHPLGGSHPIWVAEALALGLPALVVSQTANADENAAAGLLHSLGLPGLIAADEAAYIAIGTAMALDSAPRRVLRSRLKEALELAPQFLDTLAAADAFGAVLETAYDELTALGRAVFRAEPEPLRCFSAENLAEGLETGFAALAAGDTATTAFESHLALRADPAHPRVRYLRAHALVAEGKVHRATDYLMAALPHFVGDKEFWFFLAQTLRQNRQAPEAIQALESCLRLDGQQVEPQEEARESLQLHDPPACARRRRHAGAMARARPDRRHLRQRDAAAHNACDLPVPRDHQVEHVADDAGHQRGMPRHLGRLR